MNKSNSDGFKGFRQPESNYSKLPHQFIDLLPTINALTEMMVLIYLLRHTWGYNEYGIPKRMTIDEFMYGRKREDGTRMDAGTGLSEQGVRNGIEKALAHQYITVDVDASDKARIKKSYALNNDLTPHDVDPEVKDLDLKTLGAEVKDLDLNPLNVIPRSEKETSERNLKKETKAFNTPPLGAVVGQASMPCPVCKKPVQTVTTHEPTHTIMCYECLAAADANTPNPHSGAPLPRLLNLKTIKTVPEGAIYIGRANKPYGQKQSIFANMNPIGARLGRDGAIAAFEQDLLDSAEMLRAIPTLRGHDLVCWCPPERCHGEILLKYAALSDAELEQLALDAEARTADKAASLKSYHEIYAAVCEVYGHNGGRAGNIAKQIAGWHNPDKDDDSRLRDKYRFDPPGTAAGMRVFPAWYRLYRKDKEAIVPEKADALQRYYYQMREDYRANPTKSVFAPLAQAAIAAAPDDSPVDTTDYNALFSEMNRKSKEKKS